MNRFWIVLGVVIIVLVGLFVATKPESTSNTFDGDATAVQADDYKKGAEAGKVTLIEYGDFQCPSCAASYPLIQEVAEEYKKDVTFIFRHFPLTTIHPNAYSASRAAEAAAQQGKFWQMHDKLFETQSLWGQLATNQQSTFEGYAKELGLDLEKFKADYVSEATATRINRDTSSGQKLGVAGTPTFILNGQKIETPRDKDGFKVLLDEAIKNAK